MTLLARLFGGLAGPRRRAAADNAEVLVLYPFDGPVYAVGDVHGCLDLYRTMEAAILRDAAAYAAPATIVLLGDMIDRGPSSAALIEHLVRPLPGPVRRLCLMGNHEAMMLAFLESPRHGSGWLQAGGHETLMSYGVTSDPSALAGLTGRAWRHLLAAHLPESHVALLRGAPAAVHVGPYLLAHAGADATAPLTSQPRAALLWGSAGATAPAGLTLVHGHYVTQAPVRGPCRIGIDTGAYATGRLTVLRLSPGQEPAVLTSPPDRPFRDLPPDESGHTRSGIS